MNRYLLGVDVGGTFTDFIAIDRATGAIRVGKQLTTPHDPAEGILAGWADLVQEHGLRTDELDVVVHATTLVTNAVIERKGARVGLITTEGTRDVLEIGRGWRYDIYDLKARMPEPLVPRRLRRGVRERLDKHGEVETPLDEQQVAEVLSDFVQEGVESVAVCFLHCYTNPTHERRVRELISARYPSLSSSLSSEIYPEIGEYERTSTTVINAFVKPKAERYLHNLFERLRTLGFRGGSLYIMLSNGGVCLVDAARESPVRMIESGPAAGAMAAALYSAACGSPNLLGFDMGGTTAKMCLIERGEPATTTSFETARVNRFKKGSGLPVMVPSIDLIEIGAGGGSIAGVDRLGLLHVGPESAEADPGPACYGRGGKHPTVTDADLVLGYLDPEYFLGGKMRLDRARAEAALAEHVGRPLGIDAVAAARAVHRLVNENMANAARIHVLEKGRDPRQFALLAFGGAGPVHARQVARLLGSPELVAPLAAGVTSALGLLAAPLVMDFVRTYVSRLDEMNWDHLNRLLEEMAEQGAASLALAGLQRGDLSFQRVARMRYSGQGREVIVPIPLGRLSPDRIPEIQAAYDAVYQGLFDRLLPGAPVEGVSWRVIASGPRPDMQFRLPQEAGRVEGALKGRRPAYFEESGGFVETAVYDRYRLGPGVRLAGPAILEEREATLVVGPGEEVAIDEGFNARVSLRPLAAATAARDLSRPEVSHG